MKLKTVLCLALVGAAVAADPSTSDATGGATGAAGNDGLKSVVADLERGKSEFVSSYAKITVGPDSLCAIEKAHANKIVTQPEDAALYKERTESKQALLDAIGGRLESLSKFLAKLKAVRSKLHNHINNVNNIFQKKFLETSHNMAAAAKVLHDLGLIKVMPYNPQFNPIKNFDGFEYNEKTALMELDMRKGERSLALQQMEMEAGLVLANNGDQAACTQASKAAFDIFKLSLALNEELYGRFEEERSVLKSMREGLLKMITEREAKVAALKKQQGALAQALKDASHPFLELRQNFRPHLVQIEKSCDKFKEDSVKVQAEYDKVIGMAKTHEEAAAKQPEKEGNVF